MKLAEALRANQSAKARQNATNLRVALCCGFTSLQLGQFLSAHLHLKLSDSLVELVELPFGDAIGSLDLATGRSDVTFLIVEWQDLDPRLGIRQADWRPSVARDILETVRLRLDQLVEKATRASKESPVHISLPQLPLPTVLPPPADRQDAFHLELEALLIDSSRALLEVPAVFVLARELTLLGQERYDVKGDLRFGCPYSVTLQSLVAARLAASAYPEHAPLKGLITDLDDTLWRGIIGEAGVDQVSWSLDQHSHLHAVYQQQLRALAERGVLLAIASKNDRKVAEAGLKREDINISCDDFFPCEIHWQPKSESVSSILKAWNIGADSVLFIDDSPGELAEVKATHPEIQTRLFPTRDDPGTLSLIEEIESLFAKAQITEEDRLRSASIRSSAASKQAAQRTNTDPEAFLRQCQARTRIRLSLDDDPRAFELINKTNQFNLNGVRLSPKDWIDLRQQRGAFVMTLEYEDKFGKLGKVSVLTGIHNGQELRIQSWVLSCRAFSRRLEHLCLNTLFDHFELDRVHLHFQETDRNEPVARFLSDYSEISPLENVTIEKKCFLDRCPTLYHSLDLIHHG